MKQFGDYLCQHSTEDFWKEVLASSAHTVIARNQTLKIEAGKLRNEKNRLILDNISDIMEGELKRTEIRNQLRDIKRASQQQDIDQELREVEQLPKQQPREFLIERERDVGDLFELPKILAALQNSNPSLYAETIEKLQKQLAPFPKLRAALLDGTGANTTESAQAPQDKYLEYKKLIECKELNEADLVLLETQYESIVSERLKRRALGRYLVQLWLNNSQREVFWARDAALLKEQFERQKHF